MREDAFEMLRNEGDEFSSSTLDKVSATSVNSTKRWKVAFIVLSIFIVLIFGLLFIGTFVKIDHESKENYGLQQSFLGLEQRVIKPNTSVYVKIQDMNSTTLMSIINGYLKQLRVEASLAHRKSANALNQTNDQLHKVMLGWYGASDNSSYKLFTEKVNYWTALIRCQNMGGTILMKGLRNATIFRELVSANVIHLHTAGCKTWIGLRYQQKDCVWIDNGTTNPLVVQWNEVNRRV